MTTGQLRPWLSPAEAGEVVGMSRQAVTRMCVDGKIQALPRKKGAPWQIITAHLMRQFGMNDIAEPDGEGGTNATELVWVRTLLLELAARVDRLIEEG